MNFLVELLSDYTVRTVLLGTTIIGVTSGILGSFALLRQQSLLGDAISHAALPGIALTFLWTHSTNPALLLFGGALAGFLGTILINIITHFTRIKKDAALGIVLSVFFGFGLVLMTHIQKKPIAQQSILNKFLFGNASTLMKEDLILMVGVCVLLLLAVFFLWKELKLIAFDRAYAQVQGYPIFLLELVLTVLFVCSIVIGLQTVGVVLMSTMFVAPAAAARQWTFSFERMVILAGLFGALSGVIGSGISSCISGLPTGPTIVVVMSIIVAISLLFSPKRGIMWKNVRVF